MDSSRAVSLLVSGWMVVTLGAWLRVSFGSMLPWPLDAATVACVMVGAPMWGLMAAAGILFASLGVLRRIGGRE